MPAAMIAPPTRDSRRPCVCYASLVLVMVLSVPALLLIRTDRTPSLLAWEDQHAAPWVAEDPQADLLFMARQYTARLRREPHCRLRYWVEVRRGLRAAS